VLTKHVVKNGGKQSRRTSRIIHTDAAKVLRDLRIQSGLSMRKAAVALGFSDSYISHIENGRVDVPTGENLDKFLILYGGLKQKSFYERVRRYSETADPRQGLLDLVARLHDDKLMIAKQILLSL
jgi:transcriptional regulator with XRE-family HTH domain